MSLNKIKKPQLNLDFMYCKLQLQVKGTNNQGVAVEGKKSALSILTFKISKC